MKEIKLSIIVPFYNVEAYIAQCLDSIFNQDIPEEEYEVICVDDCSPDNSRDIVKSYAEKHSNLKLVINNRNRKLGGARNAGMSVAQGEYIWFVDSDDFIKDNILGEICSVLEDGGLDIVHFSHAEARGEDIVPTSSKEGPFNVVCGTELFFDQRFVWWKDFIVAWNKIYKRSFLEENSLHFAEDIMHEDCDFSIDVFAKAHYVRHIESIAYFYRNNPESITRKKHTTEHMFYWIDLCHRLCSLKNDFLYREEDPRFQPLLNAFIRSEIEDILEVYDTLIGAEKKKGKKMIRKGIDFSLKPFISRKTFWLIKLGVY